MASGKLGIGVIGANLSYGWSNQTHLPAIRALPEYELVAVCTAHRDTAEATAKHYGVPKAYWDYRKLVEDPDIQVVDVVVRVPLHYELAKAALEAGKHVYCEWPLGRVTGEAEELAALAQRRGLHTMVGLQARGAPGVLHLRQLIAEGYVGTVLAASMVQFSGGILSPRPASQAWGAPFEMGRNVLTIAGGHNLDAFAWAVGEFAEVSGRISTQVREWPLSDAPDPVPVTAPDNVLVQGALTNGAVASVHVGSIPWHASTARIEVYGTEGTLVATARGSVQGQGVRLQGGRAGERELASIEAPEQHRVTPADFPGGPAFNVGQLLALLAQGILSGTPAGPDFAEAARRHRLLDAIVRSSQTGAVVSIPAKDRGARER